MKPIENFRDHPYLKYDDKRAVFIIKYSRRSEMYLYTKKEVKRILPLKIDYSNIGEPYKEMVRLTFLNEEKEDWIDIDSDDLQDLLNLLKVIEVKLSIPNTLLHLLPRNIKDTEH